MSSGKIVQIIGAVVDVEFPRGEFRNDLVEWDPPAGKTALPFLLPFGTGRRFPWWIILFLVHASSIRNLLTDCQGF